MSILTDIRKTSTLVLPSYPEDKLEIYDSLLTKELKEMLKVDDDFDRGIYLLSHLIKTWTFTDDKGTILPVNETTLSILVTKDYNVLMEEVGKILSDQESKKEKS
jgi:hypothetical protein